MSVGLEVPEPSNDLEAVVDGLAAVLAACVTFTDPDDPSTAVVDYRLAHALRAWLAPQQERGGSATFLRGTPVVYGREESHPVCGCGA
ncbi:hypothetical protein [Mycobacteroides abscessus]|uniref:hypothetical protein n=1 Tax=Mycobacteroides abscessus TaxID=36809 RepID=UPI002106BF9F|nr:hypothetical protein [Mycobacteroides abscessus]